MQDAMEEKRLYGRPKEQPDMSYMDTVMHQLLAWAHIFRHTRKLLPDALLGQDRQCTVFDEGGEVGKKYRDAWTNECTYVIHDILVRLHNQHHDCWDNDLQICQEADWYMEHRDEYLYLPSDEIRPATMRRLKIANYDWTVPVERNEAEWDTTTTGHTGHDRRGRSMDRSEGIKQHPRSQSAMRIGVETPCIPLPIAEHLNDTVFVGVQATMVGPEERDMAYWIHEGQKYIDFYKQALLHRPVMTYTRQKPVRVEPWMAHLLPNFQKSHEVDAYEQKIEYIVAKFVDYGPYGPDTSILGAEDETLWRCNVIKNLTILLVKDFGWNIQDMTMDDSGEVSYMCSNCFCKQSVATYGWPEPEPLDNRGTRPVPFHRCSGLKRNDSEDMFVRQMRFARNFLTYLVHRMRYLGLVMQHGEVPEHRRLIDDKLMSKVEGPRKSEQDVPAEPKEHMLYCSHYVEWPNDRDSPTQSIRLRCCYCREMYPLMDMSMHKCIYQPYYETVNGLWLCGKCMTDHCHSVWRPLPIGCIACDHFAKWVTFKQGDWTGLKLHSLVTAKGTKDHEELWNQYPEARLDPSKIPDKERYLTERKLPPEVWDIMTSMRDKLPKLNCVQAYFVWNGHYGAGSMWHTKKKLAKEVHDKLTSMLARLNEEDLWDFQLNAARYAAIWWRTRQVHKNKHTDKYQPNMFAYPCNNFIFTPVMTSYADWSRIQGAYEAGYNEFCMLNPVHRALPPPWWNDKYEVGDYSPSWRSSSSSTVSHGRTPTPSFPSVATCGQQSPSTSSMGQPGPSPPYTGSVPSYFTPPEDRPNAAEQYALQLHEYSRLPSFDSCRDEHDEDKNPLR
jgi:hypothetical protein